VLVLVLGQEEKKRNQITYQSTGQLDRPLFHLHQVGWDFQNSQEGAAGQHGIPEVKQHEVHRTRFPQEQTLTRKFDPSEIIFLPFHIDLRRSSDWPNPATCSWRSYRRSDQVT
jgi:hypothetical protein